MKKKDFNFLILLVILTILNVIDALATAFWIDNKLASEANPVMQIWLDISPIFFITMKILLVVFCSALLWKLRDRRLTYFLLAPVIVIYSYILLKHANIALNVFF
jgi:hypothetical protein